MRICELHFFPPLYSVLASIDQPGKYVVIVIALLSPAHPNCPSLLEPRSPFTITHLAGGQEGGGGYLQVPIKLKALKNIWGEYGGVGCSRVVGKSDGNCDT